ncbi:calcium-activated chloride channel regulator 2-like isoform X1 [Argiope bruennichi]|uniref:calcium-activated chloride channel regulator 2-like isoform X1 n=1 Tax=Argiope bruennichi TaxID=94029 RepID=UPI0024950C15|nr:calcium-activated chloride channel regulator 2-like isoform X1 [Argiope bruennichi]
MILRYVVWSIFMCLVLLPIVKAEVQVDDQGYQNVLISFAPNVPSENGKEFILAIQDLVQNTSNVLRTAVGIRIAAVTFVLPLSWPVETWENITITPASSEQTKRKPDISVDATELSPFGTKPVTLQHGGCGVGGHQIILPLDFLSSTDGYPKDKLLAREWLKYRYGVFDENGFANDNLYPDYYRIPGSSEIRIAECTNSNVTYNFKKPISGDECDMDSAGDFGHCRAHPDAELAINVTSSLMYYHKDLLNMEHICGKDGHPHHSTARNKQNALCNGQSIWDVIKLSKDLENTQQEFSDPVLETIQFSYIQESKPRFVVLLEDTEPLSKKQESILFALRRFYYDLPPKSRLAIYAYNDEIVKVLNYTELTDQKRSDLGIIATFDYPQTGVCNSCGLTNAFEVLLQNSKVEEGSIFLITASPLEDNFEIPEEVQKAGICLNVLRFLDEGTEDTSYESIKGSFPCYSYEPLSISLDNLEIYSSLSHFLKKPVPELNDNFEVKTIVSGLMSADLPVTISPNPTASSFTLWTGKDVRPKSILCKADEKNVMLTKVIGANQIASFNINPMDIDITCRLIGGDPILTEVQMTTQKGNYFTFDIWIHDVSTAEKQLPIIVYAKIYFGGYPVQDANVEMVVTSENNPDVNVKMLDNGRGDPDVTQYDGIYSGYFVDFITEGAYQIAVKIDDNDRKAKLGKLNPSLRSDTCCGSKVISNYVDAPAFNMEKYITYTAKNKRPDNGYPPSRIVDLEVHIFNVSDFVLLTWTAPGGGKASSYEFYAFCDLEDCDGGKLPKWLKLNQTEPKPRPHGELEEVAFLLTPEVPKIENLRLFFAIKSVGENGQQSYQSNKAEILLSISAEASTTTAPITDDDKKLAPSDPTGIIVGGTIIGILLFLCLAAVFYLYVIKPRRFSKPSNIDANDYFQDKNQNGTEVSGSFKALSIRDSGSSSMRRVESFPVILYTHDQIKDFKKKVDPPLYKPAIAPRPWMSMNVLSNSDLKRGGDAKSIGSASTLPMNEKYRSTEMKQLDDVSLKSETPHSEEAIKV